MENKYYFILGTIAIIGIITIAGCVQKEKPNTEVVNSFGKEARMAPFDEIIAEVTILDITRAEDYPSWSDLASIHINKIVNYTREEHSSFNRLEIGDFQNVILAKYSRPTMIRCNDSHVNIPQPPNPQGPTIEPKPIGDTPQAEIDEFGNYVERWSDCPTQPPPPWTQQPWKFWKGLKENENVRVTIMYDGEHLNIIDYKTACSKEGEKIFVKMFEYCCEGLTRIAGTEFTNGECVPSPLDVFYCTKCGDGSCGLGENKCNCPEDCE